MSRKVGQFAGMIGGAGLVLSIAVGCAGKKLSTSVSDQMMIPGEKPQAEAQVASPPSAEAFAPTITPRTEGATAQAETMPEAPVPQPEPPRAEVSAEAPKMEEAKTEVPPSSGSSEPLPVEEKPSVPPLPSAGESAPSVVVPPSTPAVAEATPPAEAPPSTPAVAEATPPAEATPSTPVTSEETATLSDVFFDFDRFAIRQDAQATLEANARWLKAANGRKVLIEGHCDERGTVEYNLVLGEKRAQSVKQYLEELGVPASQIQITSFGKEKPFCTRHSEACWQQNRRAHFVLQ